METTIVKEVDSIFLTTGSNSLDPDFGFRIQIISSSLFWINLIKVLNAILRYGYLIFSLWRAKAPLRMASRGSDLNSEIGNITHEIPHKA